MFFLSPYLLYLLLFVLVLFLLSFREDKDAFEKIFPKEIRRRLSTDTSSLTRQKKYYLFLVILTLFIIALARPVRMLPSLDITQSKPSVILAIDVSKSMSNTAIYPSKLAFAKAKLSTFIAQANGFNLAVIYYANDAYMLYPLSQENTLLLDLLKDANITQKFKPNTNLFAALEAGAMLLNNHKNRHIVLFTDGGGDISREQERSFLASKQITLSALALTSKPNKSLQILTQKTAGRYQPFTYAPSDIKALIAHIKQASKGEEKTHHDIAQYREYFRYPLGLAIVLLTLLFLPLKKSFIVPLVLLSYGFQPLTLQAGILDFWHLHQAQNAREHHNYKQAIKHYKQMKLNKKGYYNLAYTLYQNSQYHDAIVYYNKALGADKKFNAKIYYNIATAYAREHKLDFAKEFYQKSLALYPTQITQENLSIMIIKLKNQRKNLHKTYEKIHFKPITGNAFAQNNPFSNYTIKLHNFIPSEEEKWFQKITKLKSPTYLQKLPTHKRSLDANLSW